MSEMSQAQAPAGGDPLDLTPDAGGVHGDVLPGAGADVAEGSGDAGGGDITGGAADLGSADPAPEGGATLDPPGTGAADEPDPASGVDPLQGTEGGDVQVPGVAGGDLESGSDPMPDMTGTNP